MWRVYVLTCLVTIYTCYGMNPYTFDVAAVEHRIDRADSVYDLLTIATEQLGIARFIAERTTFDRDSYMSAYHNSGTFDYRHMLELFCKKEFFERHDIPGYLRLLHELRILDDRMYEKACKKFELSPKELERENIAPYVYINDREKWLHHLTECRQKTCNALYADPHLGQEKLIEAIYLLTQFSSDMGSLLCVEPDKLNQPDMLKTCLQSTNHVLYNTLAILCTTKKAQETSKEQPELAAPVFLDDYYYMRYYGDYQTGFPRKAIIEKYGIYDVVNLVPMPRQTSCLVGEEDES